MSLRLYTLGRSAAVIRERAVEPSADLLFAGLLLFGLEPGRDLARRELAELLWPEAGPIRQGARLRWLLNKLRSFGLPLESTAQHARISVRDVTADYVDISQMPLDTLGPVFAGYTPTFSAPFARWLDDKRSLICGDVLRQLMPRLAAARAANDWTLADDLAAAVERVDSFNEEAVLTRAEARCRLGSKTQAIAGLDAYLEALGEDAEDLRIPAATLRRRIAVQVNASDEIPFVGRTRELDRLAQLLDGVRRDSGGSLLVVGPTGIGKTRLVDEALSRQAIHRLRVARVRWDRDLSYPQRIARLGAALLDLPGAIGASPASFAHVDTLVRESQTADGHLELFNERSIVALRDLLEAAAAENPVAIALDIRGDVSAPEAEVVRRLATWTAARPIAFVVTMRRAPSDLLDEVPALRVGSMTVSDAGVLARHLLARAMQPVDDEIRSRILARGAGNPLYLRELVRHWSQTGSLEDTPPALVDVLHGTLASLSRTATRVLETATVLADGATTDRIDRVLQLPRNQLLDALLELEVSGTVTCDEHGVLYGHALWAKPIAANVPASIVHLLKTYADERAPTTMRRLTPTSAQRLRGVIVRRVIRREWS